jgi:GT2 family glycosyltransferase
MAETTDFPCVDLSIVTYNSERWLDRFFASLAEQQYPLDRIALLIRDNGSKDGTVDAVKRLIAQYEPQFRSVRLDVGENVGFGRGHNANLARADAPFFLVTNVDLTFERDAISKVVATASSDPQEVAAWELRQKPYEHPKYYDPITLDVTWASSACILFRRDALVAVGGYEPRLFLYGEDVELSYRLRDRGYRIRYCPRAVCWHYTYETANEIKPAQFFGSTVANVLLRLRYGTPGEAFTGLAMYCALLFVPLSIPGRLKGLLRNGMRIVRDGPYFLRTRRRSNAVFPFRAWDYEQSREGAFYSFEALPVDREALPLVSIIVRTCAGRLGKLKEAVQSVLNQTYPNVELVVVEDGTSQAQAYVESIAARGVLASVQYHSIPKAGRCVGGNVGLAQSTGVYACFLDDDDLLFADHVEVLATELTKRPDLAATYSLAFQVETEPVTHDPWVYHERNRFVAYREPFSRPAIWHHNYIPIQAILFRRSLYEAHGGFNEQLERLEDWDLWVRYSLERDYLLIEKVTSLYRVPAKSGEASFRQQELDDYYAKALAARDSMFVQMTPNQVVAYAQDLAKQMYPIAVPRHWLRRVAMRIPGIWAARRLYLVGRGIARKIVR